NREREQALRVALLDVKRRNRGDQLVVAVVAHDGQGAAGQLVTQRVVDGQALDLPAVDEVVVVVGVQPGQAAALDQLLDLRGARLLLGLLLLLAVQLLVAGQLLGSGLQGGLALGIVLLGLALFLQALLFLLLLGGLLG